MRRKKKKKDRESVWETLACVSVVGPRILLQIKLTVISFDTVLNGLPHGLAHLCK